VSRLVASTLLILSLSAVPARAQAPPVPPGFADLHDDLAATLEAFAASLPTATVRSPVVFSAELPNADANRLEDLLAPNALLGTLMALDRLADVGVEAVTVNVGFPMLYRPFHADALAYRSYVAFYKTVAWAARRRGLKLIVKSGALLGTDPRVGAFYRAVPNLDYYKA